MSDEMKREVDELSKQSKDKLMGTIRTLTGGNTTHIESNRPDSKGGKISIKVANRKELATFIVLHRNIRAI